MRFCAFTSLHTTGRWAGKCWFHHNKLKYEFDFDFEVGPEHTCITTYVHTNDSHARADFRFPRRTRAPIS